MIEFAGFWKPMRTYKQYRLEFEKEHLLPSVELESYIEM